MPLKAPTAAATASSAGQTTMLPVLSPEDLAAQLEAIHTLLSLHAGDDDDDDDDDGGDADEDEELGSGTHDSTRRRGELEPTQADGGRRDGDGEGGEVRTGDVVIPAASHAALRNVADYLRLPLAELGSPASLELKRSLPPLVVLRFFVEPLRGVDVSVELQRTRGVATAAAPATDGEPTILPRPPPPKRTLELDVGFALRRIDEDDEDDDDRADGRAGESNASGSTPHGNTTGGGRRRGRALLPRLSLSRPAWLDEVGYRRLCADARLPATARAGTAAASRRERPASTADDVDASRERGRRAGEEARQEGEREPGAAAERVHHHHHDDDDDDDDDEGGAEAERDAAGYVLDALERICEAALQPALSSL